MTNAEQIAEISAEKDIGMSPSLWAYYLAAELREKNPGMDYPTQAVAEVQIMRTFNAHADTLPLRQIPSGLPWPKGEPLPPKWRDGHYMTKAELRAWAEEYARDFLGSALLAEPQAAGETALSGSQLVDFQTAQEIEWNGGPIDWERWTVKSATLTAAQAARLMAGLDPDQFESLAFTKYEKAGTAKAHARRLEQLAAGDESPKVRDTPAGWLAWADGKRESVHSAYRIAIEQAANATAPEEEATTLAGPGTPAEQWAAAKGDTARRAALAAAMVRLCQDNKTEAARRLGTKRQTIDRVLGKGAAGGAAGAAPMFAQLGGKPHEY